ncbi:hypothetical protein BDD39_000679 [Saccharococcus thermophilus]|uniref:Uncharacterized protein n=1 Tax=Saccharococcus thermophilus TaxID=29396 RepID=A0A846MEF8_9BACL|nr:hypothetical protein [Saccharococcus thermophilus]
MKGTVALSPLITASWGWWKPGISERVKITLEFHAERKSRPWRVIHVTNAKWAMVYIVNKGGTARPFSSLFGRGRFFRFSASRKITGHAFPPWLAGAVRRGKTIIRLYDENSIWMIG